MCRAAPSSDPSGHRPRSSRGSRPVLRTPAGEKREQAARPNLFHAARCCGAVAAPWISRCRYSSFATTGEDSTKG
ncbi:hypothetical protein ELH73_03250 [Rhizobium leguminosarum]|nr:hypothetical protein ELI28_03245 [Rhizobium leguminosarum]TAV77194.1 hypothetical protein ELI27_03245 [Rhizobium leguminosarum]TAX33396.1 hypothetical protein ELI06_03255 [Rhizobium leguminosarum]TAZ28941.1 hypothetical protein ELH73_03250 [Rhizobium leguminosarum]